MASARSGGHEHEGYEFTPLDAMALAPKRADMIRAIEVAARFGLQEKVDKGLVDELWDAVERTVSEEDLPAVHRAWNKIVGRRLIEAAT